MDAHHRRVGDERNRAVSRHELAQPVERPELVVDPGRCEDPAVDVVRSRIGDLAIQRLPLPPEAAELRLVLRKRALAAPAALPRSVRVDVEQHRERRPRELVANLGRGDRAAAEREHARLTALEEEQRALQLVHAERIHAALLDDLRRAFVDVHCRTAEALCDRLHQRRLARPHEADQRDMPAERVQCHWMRCT